jgi:phenylpropionate dioxygenase-like ring-hydroxylating dioxygenase large terminal subunit
MVINKRLLVYALALIVLSSFVIAGASEIMQSAVKPKKVYAINVTSHVTTQSFVFEPVPDTNITFTTGKKIGSLVIAFSTELKVDVIEQIRVRVNVSTPTTWWWASGPVIFATPQSTNWETGKAVWIFTYVAPYTTYTVQVYWRIYPLDDLWGDAHFWWRTLTVTWNKGYMS